MIPQDLKYQAGELTNIAPDAQELVNAKWAAPVYEVNTTKVHHTPFGDKTEHELRTYHLGGVPTPDLAFHGN